MGRLSFSRNSEAEQPVNQSHLSRAQGPQSKPGEQLARAQTRLAGFAQPESNLDRPNPNQVSIPQNGSSNRLIVNRRRRLRMNCQNKSFGHAQIDFQMPVPNPLLLQPKVCGAVAPDDKWKTASHCDGARLFSGEHLKLDHLGADP